MDKKLDPVRSRSPQGDRSTPTEGRRAAYNGIEIYTDGSSLGNPGRGGWGVVIIINNKSKNQKIIELSGFEKNTTNNRMELIAAIEALKYFRKSDFLNIKEIVIYTDSAYVLGGVNVWIYNWEKNGWRTANKKPVLNKELWQKLILISRELGDKLLWQKVKGHSGHIYNDMADEIATTKALLQK